MKKRSDTKEEEERSNIIEEGMSAVESRSLRSSSSSGAVGATSAKRAKSEKKSAKKKERKLIVEDVASSTTAASKEKKEKKSKKKEGESTPKKKKSTTKPSSSALSSSRSAPTSSPTTTRRNAAADDKELEKLRELEKEAEAVLILPDGEWSCSACTLINPAYASACEACETKKPKIISAAPPPSTSSSSHSPIKAVATKAVVAAASPVEGGASPVVPAEKKSKKSKKDGGGEKKKKKKKGTKKATASKGKGKQKTSSSRSDGASDDDDDDDGDYYDDGEGGDDSEVDYISGGDYSDEEVNAGLGWEEAEHEDAPAKQMFKILSRVELAKLQMKLVDSVASELGVNKWDVVILLQHYKWDVNKLHAQYWDEQKKVMKEAGIKKRKKKKKKQDKNAMVECLVCSDDVKASKVFSLACGHGPYCDSCWQYHLSVVVKNSSAEGILNSTCMWPRCLIKLNRKAFKKLAQPEDFKRYQYFLMKSYVDNTKKLSWCPSPSCTNLVLCLEDVGRPSELVRCTCGHQFCFACGLESHNPVSCDQLNKWQQRNSDDQESIRLVMATSKPCYHCGIPTTRVDGCNHMSCRKEKGGCGGEWCWMCRGDWKSHGEHTGGFYSCNKYDNSSAKDLDDEAGKLKQEADRYLHYFNRYFLHETAAKSVPVLRLKALEKQQQYRELTSGNPDFLLEAVDLLAKCRHILKYTYVYGFYLPDGSRGKDFFEYLQANAEGITERLSDQVNSPISKLVFDVTAFKNIIRVTSKYIDNLVKGIEDGLGVEGLGKK
jgi:ariadne-1